MNEKIEKNKKVTQSPTWSGICSNKVITRNGLSTSCKKRKALALTFFKNKNLKLQMFSLYDGVEERTTI